MSARRRPLSRLRWLLVVLGLYASLLVGLVVGQLDGRSLSGPASASAGTRPFPSATATTATDPQPPALTPTPSGRVPDWDHIVLLILENHAYREVLGSSQADPYLAALARQGAVAANYTAVSTAGSLPN